MSAPRPSRAWAPLAVLVAVTALGCTRVDEEPLPVIPLPENLPPPADALEERLRERGPVEASLLVPDAPPFRATLEPRGRGSFTSVLRGGVCYKLLAGGDESIVDLDAFVYDPNNVLTQRDNSVGREIVIGTERGICPGETGAWRFELAAREGEGAVIAQLWRMPM